MFAISKTTHRQHIQCFYYFRCLLRSMASFFLFAYLLSLRRISSSTHSTPWFFFGSHLFLLYPESTPSIENWIYIFFPLLMWSCRNNHLSFYISLRFSLHQFFFFCYFVYHTYFVNLNGINIPIPLLDFIDGSLAYLNFYRKSEKYF